MQAHDYQDQDSRHLASLALAMGLKKSSKKSVIWYLVELVRAGFLDVKRHGHDKPLSFNVKLPAYVMEWNEINAARMKLDPLVVNTDDWEPARWPSQARGALQMSDGGWTAARVLEEIQAPGRNQESTTAPASGVPQPTQTEINTGQVALDPPGEGWPTHPAVVGQPTANSESLQDSTQEQEQHAKETRENAKGKIFIGAASGASGPAGREKEAETSRVIAPPPGGDAKGVMTSLRDNKSPVLWAAWCESTRKKGIWWMWTPDNLALAEKISNMCSRNAETLKAVQANFLENDYWVSEGAPLAGLAKKIDKFLPRIDLKPKAVVCYHPFDARENITWRGAHLGIWGEFCRDKCLTCGDWAESSESFISDEDLALAQSLELASVAEKI